MNKYNPKEIEPKWQKFWEKNKTFEVLEDSNRPKFYPLIEFPYPSAAGLHVGHPRPFTAMDVVARKRRMEGYNVLYPIGFDAFGLPTENYAIKTGRPPAEITAENIANFTRQLKSLGYSFDWSRQVNTSDPKYYKWTQWQFLQFFKHGLAYKKNQPINWCPKDKIGLANEEVVNGCCERCGTAVEKRNKEQWMLSITKYADKLLEGLKEVDYINAARVSQENWIGKSEGAEIIFKLRMVPGQQDDKHSVTVFTTRPDTLFGATFLAISADLAKKWIDVGWNANEEVKKYVSVTLAKQAKANNREEEPEKTGVETGVMAINPVNGEEIPVWIANFVLGGVGTGALFADAHDERDFEFAKKYNIPLKVTIRPDDEAQWERVKNLEECFVGDGVHFDSDFLNGMRIAEAKEKIIGWLEEKKLGKRQVNYKLRDWVFSRQRYWGEPIPLVHCETCANKKYNFVFVHGFKGNQHDVFFDWLKGKLEFDGHTVIAVDMPNPMTPNVAEQVEFLLANDTINTSTVLLGVSLGVATILKLLEKTDVQIAKAVLVDGFIRPEFTDKKRVEVENSFDWKFDFEKIKKAAKEFVVLADNTFSVIDKNNSLDLAKNLRTTALFKKPQDRHFNGKIELEVYDLFANTGWIPLPESELPLTLPKVPKYEPTDTGESPLAAISDWVNTTCPKCGGKAQRETDTMPNWAGSSWYFLRYADPHNDKEFAGMEKLKYWLGPTRSVISTSQEKSLSQSPTDRDSSFARNNKRGGVDWYNGGMEHTVLHLLYSRFWNQFMFDIGLVPTSEPYKKRTSHGLIMGPDGEKMSKSRGNVVNPDEMVDKFGADALRAYIMFMGPFDQHVAWDTNGLVGVRRFIERVWSLQDKVERGKRKEERTNIDAVLHQTIKKVGDDIEKMSFNTAISALMSLSNEMMKEEKILDSEYWILIKLLSPFCPHVAEELWSVFAKATPDKSEFNNSITFAQWPKYDAELAKESSMKIAVQVNGKVRDELNVASDISEEEIKKLALASEKIMKWLDGNAPKKVIYVKNKLVSIVV